ncbi:MAG TPA: hypothetical protein VMU51_32660 [Mycobacteriales bacterium]|nr:hypothetical protein [Mycobacteriales bacterium]
MSAQIAGKRLSFWFAVGGASVLSPFFLHLVAERLPDGKVATGLRRFIGFTYSSGGS